MALDTEKGVRLIKVHDATKISANVFNSLFAVQVF